MDGKRYTHYNRLTQGEVSEKKDKEKMGVLF